MEDIFAQTHVHVWKLIAMIDNYVDILADNAYKYTVYRTDQTKVIF